MIKLVRVPVKWRTSWRRARSVEWWECSTCRRVWWGTSCSGHGNGQIWWADPRGSPEIWDNTRHMWSIKEKLKYCNFWRSIKTRSNTVGEVPGSNTEGVIECISELSFACKASKSKWTSKLDIQDLSISRIFRRGTFAKKHAEKYSLPGNRWRWQTRKL